MKEIPLLSAIEPKGAFYLFIDVSKVLNKVYKNEIIGSTDKLAKILIEDYNVAIVPCDDFGFNDHIRLSYAIGIEQIEKGVERIKNFVDTLERK